MQSKVGIIIPSPPPDYGDYHSHYDEVAEAPFTPPGTYIIEGGNGFGGDLIQNIDQEAKARTNGNLGKNAMLREMSSRNLNDLKIFTINNFIKANNNKKELVDKNKRDDNFDKVKGDNDIDLNYNQISSSSSSVASASSESSSSGDKKSMINKKNVLFDKTSSLLFSPTSSSFSSLASAYSSPSLLLTPYFPSSPVSSVLSPFFSFYNIPEFKIDAQPSLAFKFNKGYIIDKKAPGKNVVDGAKGKEHEIDNRGILVPPPATAAANIAFHATVRQFPQWCFGANFIKVNELNEKPIAIATEGTEEKSRSELSPSSSCSNFFKNSLISSYDSFCNLLCKFQPLFATYFSADGCHSVSFKISAERYNSEICRFNNLVEKVIDDEKDKSGIAFTSASTTTTTTTDTTDIKIKRIGEGDIPRSKLTTNVNDGNLSRGCFYREDDGKRGLDTVIEHCWRDKRNGIFSTFASVKLSDKFSSLISASARLVTNSCSTDDKKYDNKRNSLKNLNNNLEDKVTSLFNFNRYFAKGDVCAAIAAEYDPFRSGLKNYGFSLLYTATGGNIDNVSKDLIDKSDKKFEQGKGEVRDFYDDEDERESEKKGKRALFTKARLQRLIKSSISLFNLNSIHNVSFSYDVMGNGRLSSTFFINKAKFGTSLLGFFKTDFNTKPVIFDSNSTSCHQYYLTNVKVNGDKNGSGRERSFPFLPFFGKSTLPYADNNINKGYFASVVAGLRYKTPCGGEMCGKFNLIQGQTAVRVSHKTSNQVWLPSFSMHYNLYKNKFEGIGLTLTYEG